MRNGRETEVKVALTTYLRTQISALKPQTSKLKSQTSNLKSQFSDLSNLSPQTSNLKSQISIRKERTHGYKNSGGSAQKILDAGG